MNSFRTLKKYLKGEWGYAFLSFFFALLSVACKVAVPFVSGLSIDLIRQGHESGFDERLFSSLGSALLLILLFLLFGALFRYFFDFFTAHVGQRLVKKMRDEAFASLLDVPVSYLDSHAHGDLLLRLTNDIENVQSGLVTGVTALYEGLVQIAITIGFMFALHWVLALTVILLTPLSILVSRFISSHNARYFQAQNAKMGEGNAFVLESIENIEAIQSFLLEGRKKSGYAEKNLAVRKASFKATFAACWINPCTRLVNNMIYGAVICLGVYLLLEEPGWTGVAFSVGALSSFLTYSYQYMTPFNEIADAMGEVLAARASLERVEELILAPKDVDVGTSPLPETISRIDAKNVTFGYDESRDIIKDFSIDIRPGHKIALVGTTGCGKTTIINLLMRFYDPRQGGFYFNGIPSVDVPKKDLRSHIGMVLQDTWIAKGSVAENIALGKKEATRAEIVEAAKKARADDFIRQLPQGYDTAISNSSGLSTGQKQLLCVARILLLQPEIVVLDEATSNIDLRTELLLSDSFDDLMRGKTSIVVAHRLSTIRNADLILVLDQGRIIEQGNFRELMAQEGFFAELYRSQLA